MNDQEDTARLALHIAEVLYSLLLLAWFLLPLFIRIEGLFAVARLPFQLYGEKEKVAALAYFRPWDFMIWAGSYKNEFTTLVDIGELKKHISGIKIGKVTDIRVLPEKGDLVELTLSVYDDAVIKEDSKAAIKSLGLVGGKYVELTGGSPTGKLLKEGGVLRGEESLKMEELTKAGMEVVGKLRHIAENLDRIAGDPALAKSIKGTVENVEAVTANVKTMTSSKEEVALALKSFPDMIRKLDASIANLRAATEKTDAMMGENRKQIDQTMENVQELTSNVKEFTAEVKKNPWKLLRKP